MKWIVLYLLCPWLSIPTICGWFGKEAYDSLYEYIGPAIGGIMFLHMIIYGAVVLYFNIPH